MVVLRRQGLHAWIAMTVAASHRRARAEPTMPAGARALPGVPAPLLASLDPSPLICVCTDMLLSHLTHPNIQEVQ